jgi:GT2 family glycosyltransferase
MPEISIVIPTLGRPAKLRRTLDRLEDQSAPAGSFEAIVVADRREEQLAAVERSVAPGERGYRTRLLRAERPGAAAARNGGWRAADSSLVLFIGDDVLAERRLVAEHLRWHAAHPEETVAVLGHVRWARELRVTPFMRWLEHGIQFDYPAIEGTEAGWGRFYTANVSLKAALLERVGGFDAETFPFLYEDLDLARRMQDLGLRLLYNVRASAEHLHPVTLEDYRERVAEVARAERRFCRKHPDVAPYFRRLFEEAADLPPARGRGAALLRILPRATPWLGRRAWASADLYFRQQLAPGFLAAWGS